MLVNITMHILHNFPQGFNQAIFYAVVSGFILAKQGVTIHFATNTVLKLLEVVICNFF